MLLHNIIKPFAGAMSIESMEPKESAENPGHRLAALARRT